MKLGKAIIFSTKYETSEGYITYLKECVVSKTASDVGKLGIVI